jgi:hypothetical protein
MKSFKQERLQEMRDSVWLAFHLSNKINEANIMEAQSRVPQIDEYIERFIWAFEKMTHDGTHNAVTVLSKNIFSSYIFSGSTAETMLFLRKGRRFVKQKTLQCFRQLERIFSIPPGGSRQKLSGQGENFRSPAGNCIVICLRFQVLFGSRLDWSAGFSELRRPRL